MEFLSLKDGSDCLLGKKQGESALNSHVLLLLMLQMHKCFDNKSINQFTSLFMSK